MGRCHMRAACRLCAMQQQELQLPLKQQTLLQPEVAGHHLGEAPADREMHRLLDCHLLDCHLALQCTK